MLQLALYPGSHTDQKWCRIQNISYVHQSREFPIMYISDYMGNSLYVHQWAQIYNGGLMGSLVTINNVRKAVSQRDQ